MAHTFHPDDSVSSVTLQEAKDLEDILECIRTLRQSSGWGVVEISFKAGDIDEIITSVRRKPKLEN